MDTYDIKTQREKILKNINQSYENSLQQDIHNHVQNWGSITRNLLLVGASKSGKTTLRNVLEDPRYIPKQLTLLSIPDAVVECSRNISAKPTMLSLNIIEIPSSMINEKSNLSNINQACIKEGIDNIHLVCFCTSITDGIDGSTIKLFKRVVRHFREENIRPNLCFIITRCETKDSKQQQNIRNEILCDTEFEELTKNQADRIYFSGSLNPDDYERATNTLYYQFKTVYNYRKKLLQLLESDIKPMNISQIRVPDLNRSPQHLTESDIKPTDIPQTRAPNLNRSPRQLISE